MDFIHITTRHYLEMGQPFTGGVLEKVWQVAKSGKTRQVNVVVDPLPHPGYWKCIQ